MVNMIFLLLLCFFPSIYTYTREHGRCNTGNMRYYNFIDTAKIIKTIREKCYDINTKGSAYNKIQKDLFGESLEGAVLVGYFDNNQLKKITGTFYGETHKTTSEYYFDDNDLLFVYHKRTNYNGFIYDDTCCKVISTEEERYYFYQNRLIKWVSGNNVVLPNSDKFLNYDNYEIQSASRYKKLLME